MDVDNEIASQLKDAVALKSRVVAMNSFMSHSPRSMAAADASLLRSRVPGGQFLSTVSSRAKEVRAASAALAQAPTPQRAPSRSFRHSSTQRSSQRLNSGFGFG